eukprot:scaffold51155_cov66-Cyclotella_meneghiniana.AAC.2
MLHIFCFVDRQAIRPLAESTETPPNIVGNMACREESQARGGAMLGGGDPAVEVTNVVDFFASSMAAKQIWPKKRLRGCPR